MYTYLKVYEFCYDHWIAFVLTAFILGIQLYVLFVCEQHRRVQKIDPDRLLPKYRRLNHASALLKGPVLLLFLGIAIFVFALTTKSRLMHERAILERDLVEHYQAIRTEVQKLTLAREPFAYTNAKTLINDLEKGIPFQINGTVHQAKLYSPVPEYLKKFYFITGNSVVPDTHVTFLRSGYTPRIVGFAVFSALFLGFYLSSAFWRLIINAMKEKHELSSQIS